MNISSFVDKVTKLVDENEFLNTNILFGNLNNEILNYNIDQNTFERFKGFIESRYKMESKKIKIYSLNDNKLYSYDDSTHICIRELPCKYCDFKLADYRRSNLSFRLISRNYRMIDNINFPSISEYDNIEEIDIDYCTIKYKNSEIILEFQNNNDIQSIFLKTKIDKYNISNFIQNFQFIISKLLIKRFNFSSSRKSSSRKSSSRKSSSRKSSYKTHLQTEIY